MRKSESLFLLDSLGLNTIDYFITKDKQEASHYLAKHINKKRSMRTERGEEFLCPFYYNQPAEELVSKALKHIDEGYTLLFSPSLDWKDCIAFGATALTEDLDDHVDVVFGPGLTRELDTHKDKKSISIDLGSISPFLSKGLTFDQTRILHTNYQKVKLHCSNHRPCILEWSLYPYGVGKLEKHFIWWELRSY